jgi:hypothetical protein
MPNEATDEFFPPEVCPICGYSLQGAPAEGICPECGNAYDASVLIVHGWACGQHANVANSRGRRLLFTMLFPLWVLWQFMFTSNVWRLTVGGLWLASIAFDYSRRKSTDHPGGIQLRMNRNGILQIDNLRLLRNDPARALKKPLTPWNLLKPVTCKIDPSNRLHLNLEQRRYRLTSYPVDAELQCTEQQAKNLVDLISKWRGTDAIK